MAPKRCGWPVLMVLAGLLCGVSVLRSQDAIVSANFDEQSLAFRTALHYDPLLEPAFDSLVRLYRESGRERELLGLYEGHIGQYPNDAGAKTVLLRLLRVFDPRAMAQRITAFVQQHPDSAPLHYLLYRYLDEDSDARHLAALSRAIDLQTNASRRREWIEELLEQSGEESGRELADRHLVELLEAEKESPPRAILDLSRLMQRYRFWELSRTALDWAGEANLGPEEQIERQILLARAESEMDDRAAAGKRLDQVLERLAGDHWRRPEVLSLRVSVIANEEERDEMIESARVRWQEAPGDGEAVMRFSDLLLAANRSEEALAVLRDAALAAPGSTAVEERALSLLETMSDSGELRTFLESILDKQPERVDLRFRLVKVLFRLGKDAEAGQDLEVVKAALAPEERPLRLLELSRFLQEVDRLEPAATLLEEYLEQFPGRLDVTRELAEVYAVLGEEERIDELLASVNALEAEDAEFLDLSQYLLDRGHLLPAKRILSERFDAREGRFETGLLLIRVLGELGEPGAVRERIESVRGMADTAPRYAAWLTASLDAEQLLERLPGFFETEQERFSYSSGEWTPERIERFLILCEEAGKRRLGARVASAIRGRISDTGLNKATRVRFRRLLVSALAGDPDHFEEVEGQLRRLVSEDPEASDHYRARLALLYNDANRADLAEREIAGIEWERIDDANLLRDLFVVVTEFRYLDAAERVLAGINRLEPRDVFSWEKRLSLLAATGRESEFRAVVRELLEGGGALSLRESTRLTLGDHLADSYWRSISRLLASRDAGDLVSALPLLDTVERDSSPGQERSWVIWARAYILVKIGRESLDGEAASRWAERVSSGEGEVVFPDGLALSAKAATALLESAGADAAPADKLSGVAGLTGAPKVSWVFECETGARIVAFERVGDSVVVRDDQGRFYRLDGSSGKLVWTIHPPRASALPVPPPGSGRDRDEDGLSPVAGVGLPGDFVAGDDRFFFVSGREVRCHDLAGGEVIWVSEADRPSAPRGSGREGGAVPPMRLAAGRTVLVTFDPVSGMVRGLDRRSGKLLWHFELSPLDADSRDGRLVALNSGLVVADDLCFVYGHGAVALDIDDGFPVWRIEATETRKFPVRIRESREDQAEDAGGGGQTEPAEGSRDEVPDVWSGRKDPVLFDYLGLDARSGSDAWQVLDTQAQLLAPAVHWAKSRLRNGAPAKAHVGAGYLWLMGQGGLHRISLELPMVSRSFPVSGVFLGESRNHAWFVDGNVLRHVDYYRNRVTEHPAEDLGSAESLRGLVEGSRVFVRGSRGIRVINAWTGRLVAEWSWPEQWIEYRDWMEVDPGVEPVEQVWQGVVRRKAPGLPRYCFPIEDRLAGNGYLTVFGDRRLVLFSSSQESGSTR